MKKFWAWVLSACLAVLSACSSIGSVAPETPKQGYVYAVTANAAVRTATADALKAGKVSSETARAILTGTDAARTLLDESLDVADAGGSAEKVAAALDLVVKLAETLKADGVEVPGL